MTKLEKEIFYFSPQKYGFISSSIDEVYLAGEFNEWGKNTKLLANYRLTKDKANRWIGVFEVPMGRKPYKFLLNKTAYYPNIGSFYYSTVSTPEWAKMAVWYQIMPDRWKRGSTNNPVPNLIPWDSPPDYFNNFGGDLKGIKEGIPYLKNLFGSLKDKALYLNPINLSLASNHKYWPEDHAKIDPQFGTEKDLKELIEALHIEGAKIILDLVYNHTGINHYAFLDILKNGDKSKYKNWYRDLPHLPHEKLEIPILEDYTGNKPQNIEIENNCISVWGGKYKFPVTDSSLPVDEILNTQPYYRLIHLYNKPNYKCWAGFFEIPELETRDPEVKEYLFDAARKFIKMGIDGFRLDVPDILSGAHEFWKEFREHMREEAVLNGRNPDNIYIVGEIWTNGEITSSFLYADTEGKPERFDAIMNYPVRESILNFFSGEILNPATDSIKGYGEIPASELDQCLHFNLFNIPWETDRAQFNVFSSHDTRRLRTILNDDRKFKAALMMQFTLIGAPTIYYGDELGMSGGKDPANRAAMKWDIYNDLLHHPEEASIFNLYKKLIDLRDRTPCLIESPLFTVMINDERKIYSYARYGSDNDCILVVIAREGIKEDLKIDISELPFEDLMDWIDPVTGKSYFNYGKSIVIKPEDFSESFGIILLLRTNKN